jgi:hypothetical protein
VPQRTLSKKVKDQAQWHKTVILIIQEEEIRMIEFPCQPRQKVTKTPSQLMAGHWCTPVIPRQGSTNGKVAVDASLSIK